MEASKYHPVLCMGKFQIPYPTPQSNSVFPLSYTLICWDCVMLAATGDDYVNRLRNTVWGVGLRDTEMGRHIT